MIAAFSRSSSPMRPIWLDSVMCAAGSALRKIAPARCSTASLTGENTDVIAMVSMPFACDVARDAEQFLLVERRDRPAVEFVAAVREIAVVADGERRSSGQSTIGGSDAVAGRPSRTAAVGARSRRCTTALVKWVVPIITASTASARRSRRMRAPSRARRRRPSTHPVSSPI